MASSKTIAAPATADFGWMQLGAIRVPYFLRRSLGSHVFAVHALERQLAERYGHVLDESVLNCTADTLRLFCVGVTEAEGPLADGLSEALRPGGVMFGAQLLCAGDTVVPVSPDGQQLYAFLEACYAKLLNVLQVPGE